MSLFNALSKAPMEQMGAEGVTVPSTQSAPISPPTGSPAAPNKSFADMLSQGFAALHSSQAQQGQQQGITPEQMLLLQKGMQPDPITAAIQGMAKPKSTYQNKATSFYSGDK